MVRIAWTIALFLITVVTSLVYGQNAVTMPQRKAFIGVLGKASEKGIIIDSVIANSTMAKLKLKKGDVVETINGTATKTLESYGAAINQIRANDKITVQYLRENKTAEASTKAIMKPLETSAFADVIYDWVKFKNGYLRTITRKPKGKTNLPCILLIPGYGCGSIDNYSKSYNGKLMDEWLKNGFAVVTIEKSGMGDSFGCEPCAEANLTTDIESFDAGYKYMEQLSFVDPSNLFIFGHSMGGTIAPEVAKLHNPKGVMVFGSVFRPWSEFLLEMHRVQKPLLEGLNYQQTEDFTREIQKIYYEFFVLKKSPEELVAIPEYKDLMISELNYVKGSTNMWGRSWKFWQQLDSLDLAKSWQEVKCPVLILHGGSDYEQCSMVEPMLTQKTINEKHPGAATWITISGLDHFMMNSKDWTEAAKNFKEQQYAKGNFNYRIAEETIKWLKSKT